MKSITHLAKPICSFTDVLMLKNIKKLLKYISYSLVTVSLTSKQIKRVAFYLFKKKKHDDLISIHESSQLKFPLKNVSGL